MTWKDELGDRIPAELGREIDTFENQIALKRRGRMDDKVFAETRLRRGAYGQRYDNGQRNDGNGVKTLPFPSNGLTKGPDTVWDAPGMQRIKIPFGGLTAEQMDTLADLAEEYSDGICHVTTRQDVQLHFVHIDDTPSLMRRLAAVGITTREACGNTVRNVTACPLAGVCRDETFDVTPYARASMRFLLGHPDAQDFGRKFKVAFSGCRQHACGLVNMHDFGAIAVTRETDGRAQRGFEVHVGGGLGAVPHEAKLFDPFMAETEVLPTLQAIARVFARLGEKRNRARARIKFLVARLGIDEFRRLVQEERRNLAPDERWTAHLADLSAADEQPLKAGEPLGGGPAGARWAAWSRSNVYRQRQPGYATVTVSLPLGDITGDQLRGLADVARRFAGDTVRTTVEQNIVLRWVRESDLPALHRALDALGLARPGAQSIGDVTACPGTDTCKLGIASSRGLAAELERRVRARTDTLDVWNGDWRASLAAGLYRLRAVDGSFGVDLRLESGRGPTLHGENGFSRKGPSAGNASQYYSLTRMPTTGRVRLDDEWLDVAGASWMDHEFGTTFLEPGQAGWDWFSLQLDDGAELMVFQLRRTDGGPAEHSAGTWVDADGAAAPLGRDDVRLVPGRRWASPASGAAYPVEWRVEVPARRARFEVAAALDAQEMDTAASTGVTYWEGAVTVTGRVGDRPVRGRGYLEMTGYAGRPMSEVFR